MAEQLRLNQAFGERRAVYADERLVFSRSAGNDGLRDQFLASPTFAANQHVDIALCHPADSVVDQPHRLAAANQLAKRIPALRLSADRYRTVSNTLREFEKVKRSEARLRLIIEALPTGVVLLDQGGKVLAMNMAGVQQFGITSPQDIVPWQDSPKVAQGHYPLQSSAVAMLYAHTPT